ncbi:MAG: hypothetical protein JWM74_5716 [Myxococcaceae bacterium]|nr:hypothetical protein [Myxococcaceae bacterium]
MELQQAVVALGVAVAAGGLIGAERQQAHAGRAGDFGGIRTFPLLAVLGVLGALLRPALGLTAIGGLLIGVTGLLAISYARASPSESGLTSELAALVTFGLGVLAGTPEVLPDAHRYLLVAAIAAITMALLALKTPLHGFMAKVSTDDIYATTKFIVLAVVVIPLLPNRTYGPLDVLNPSKIGLMIALVAGVSFSGYVVARTIGSDRGMLVTALIGGLVSSTAVTLTFAGRAKQEPALASLCGVAILAGSTTMFARMLVVVGVVDPALLGGLLIPLGTMTLTGYVLSAVLYRRETKRPSSTAGVPLRNPFELKKAVQFGLLFGFVLFVAKAAQIYIGRDGLLASSALAGVADVDAITLSLTELHRRSDGITVATATTGIALAAIANTIAKAGIAVAVGGWKLGARVGSFFLITLGAGGLALAAMSLLR